MSGIMSFTGQPGAERPTACGVPISDLNAGTFAALAVLAALNHRHVTGEGQHVETSLLESALAYTVWETGLYLANGDVAQPSGARHRLSAPYEALKTADGFIVVGVNSNRLWSRLCDGLASADLADDERFASPRTRFANRDALRERLEAILAADTTEAWVERLQVKGVPCGPLNTIDQAWADPQIRHRGLMARVGGRDFVRAPIKMSKTPVSLTRGVAEIGEHSREVLAEAGFTVAEIEALAAQGAVLAPQQGPMGENA
jgi:formyl-CoA transferase